MDDVDAKFKRRVVAALHTVSPGLAAVHATRLRRAVRSPDVGLSPLHCTRCGCLSVTTRVAAAQRPRLKARTRRSSKRENKDSVAPSKRGPCVIKSCSACGFFEAMHLAVQIESNASKTNTSSGGMAENESTGIAAELDGDYKDSGLRDEQESKGKVPAIAKGSGSRPSQSIHPKPSLSSTRQPVTTSKKPQKNGLQEMLARSKAKTQEMDSTAVGHSGLAAFLNGL